MFYLLQYAATGALFYTAYQNSEEQFYISRLNCLPEIQIVAKNATYYSEWNHLQRTRKPERMIQDEHGKSMAVLIKVDENEFLLRDAEGELTIVREKDFFCGKSGCEVVFTAHRIDNLRELQECYKRQDYDLTYGYQVQFEKTVLEQRRLWICSFPMLRF